jgi:hypothetical protein
MAVLLACAPPPVIRSDWQREDGFSELLDHAHKSFEQIQNLTVEAGIELRQGKERERGTALIQMKGADLFRLEVRGPFYSHIFTAVQEGDSLTVYGRAVGGAWKGLARGPLLFRLTGIDLSFYKLRHALLGVVEPGSIATEIDIKYPRADRAIVPFYGPGVLRRLWIDVHRGLVARERVETLGGQVLLERRFEDYRRFAALILPQHVHIAQGETVIELDYRSYDFDKVLSVDSFFKGIPQAELRRIQ